MNITKIGIGEYRNIDNVIDLADICDEVSRLIEHFRCDIFLDFSVMQEAISEREPTRRIWSIRKTGTWYTNIEPYNNVILAQDTEPIIQFLVESNAEGEMTFTRIR